jgi:hypothetical protein
MNNKRKKKDSMEGLIPAEIEIRKDPVVDSEWWCQTAR